MVERKLAIVLKLPEGETFKPLKLLAETGINAQISVPENQTITKVVEGGNREATEANDRKFGVIVEFPPQKPFYHALAERKIRKHLGKSNIEMVRANHTQTKEGTNHFAKVPRRIK